MRHCLLVRSELLAPVSKVREEMQYFVLQSSLNIAEITTYTQIKYRKALVTCRGQGMLVLLYM